MSVKKFAVAFALLMVVLSTNAQGALVDSSGKYIDTTIRGWKVYVSTDIANPRLVARAFDTLDKELAAIQSVLPPTVMPQVKQVSLWLDYTVPPNTVSHYYYESPAELTKQGWDIRKEGSIGTQIVDYVNASHDSLPLIKWFAYAYLHRELGLNNWKIITPYQKARDSGIYNFPFHNRTLINNASDYFAILSEAYFAGMLPYPPYDKKRLRSLDPTGYAMVEKLWNIP